MKRVGGLFERIACFPALVAAARRAARGKRGSPEVARFLFDLEHEALRLEAELRQGRWQPSPFRCFVVRDPKTRRIAAVPFADRVVHHAIVGELEPLLEARADAHSYACRTGKGTFAALAEARWCIQRWPWFVKLDISAFFSSVSHDRLEGMLGRVLKDRALLTLLSQIIRQPLPGNAPGRGLAIGSLCSQHLANFYLAPLDRFVRTELRPSGYLRYMDDFLLFGARKDQLRVAVTRLGQWLAEVLALSLNPQVTLLAPASQGLPFLGFRTYPGVVLLRPATLRRLRRRARRRLSTLAGGGPGATPALSSLASLVGHVGHASSLLLRRSLFATMPGGRGANRAPTG